MNISKLISIAFSLTLCFAFPAFSFAQTTPVKKAETKELPQTNEQDEVEKKEKAEKKAKPNKKQKAKKERKKS